MAVTGTKTVRDLTTSALRKAGISDWSQTPEAEESVLALTELNYMLKAWQNQGYNLWTYAEQILTPVAKQSVYDLSPIRPVRIHHVRLRTAAFSAGGTDIPMIRMTRDEYLELPNKQTSGTPTQWYYDRQREAAKFYIWPVLASVTAQTIRISYEREQEDIASLNDTLDLPGEWWEAAVYSLADRLLDTWRMPDPSVTAKAEYHLRVALGSDREQSVFFGLDR